MYLRIWGVVESLTITLLRNSLPRPSVEEFRKLVSSWQSYGKEWNVSPFPTDSVHNKLVLMRTKRQIGWLTLAITHHCSAVISTLTASTVRALSVPSTRQADTHLTVTQLATTRVDTVTMAITRLTRAPRLHRVAIVTNGTPTLTHKPHYQRHVAFILQSSADNPLNL